MFTGPVWIPKLYNGRNHTFFLFAWEKYQLHLGGVAQSTLPTAAERNGDFSDILGPASAPVPGGTPYPGITLRCSAESLHGTACSVQPDL